MIAKLLLPAVLGALAIAPGAASAKGPTHSSGIVLPDVRIVVRDGAKVVHHRHSAKYLHPQPWPRHVRPHRPGPRRHVHKHRRPYHPRVRAWHHGPRFIPRHRHVPAWRHGFIPRHAVRSYAPPVRALPDGRVHHRRHRRD